MKERPILFRGEMVRAILAGRKTQTRRVLNPQPPADFELFSRGLFYTFTPGGARGPGVEGWTTRCPFVHVDRLWVREAWAMQAEYCVAYKADGECGAMIQDGAGGWSWIHHGWLAGISPKSDGRFYDLNRYGGRWRPSIHMPRWASRISLEVAGVRVERVRDISNEDARAEGVHGVDWGHGMVKAAEELFG